MEDSAKKGNNSIIWQALLECLSEKLQLNLLDKLRRVQSYHCEENVLYISPGNEADVAYFKKDAVMAQLTLHAQSCFKNNNLKVTILSE